MLHNQNHTNVVILLADNLAYDDVGIFRGAHGSATGQSPKKRSRTPNLDRAAAEGRRLLNWNSPAVLCSASRAALLTGE
jgi:arylsulfatase A-like enzyme